MVNNTAVSLVSFAAVIRVFTQCFSPLTAAHERDAFLSLCFWEPTECMLLLSATPIKFLVIFARRLLCVQKQNMTDAHMRNNDLDPGILTKWEMNVTPKKSLNSDTNCFICSAAVTSKQRKSGSTGTSSFDLQGLINKALDIDLNVYSNSDVAMCIKCYKSLVKYQKAKEHVKEIKSELKSSYSASGRRVKRLLRTENINELTAGSGTSVKKHLSFVSLNEFPTTCSSSNLTPSSSALPRLTISPIGKPQGCLFDNGMFSLVRSAFAAPFVTSSPKINRQISKKLKQRRRSSLSIPVRPWTKPCLAIWNQLSKLRLMVHPQELQKQF